MYEGWSKYPEGYIARLANDYYTSIMKKSLDFFELFNDWLQDKERIFNCHKALWLLNATFKGIGYILFCNNPVSGLLFLGAFASAWWVIVPYCLAGCAIATITAFLLRQNAVLIGSGFFGYNGALIGLTWPFFWPFGYFSPPLLILAAALSTLFAIALLELMSHRKMNLPIISIPFVIIFLMFLNLAYASGLLPKYSYDFAFPPLNAFYLTEAFKRVHSMEEWLSLGKLVIHHAVTIGIFFLGILVHSRISALLAFTAGSLSIITAFILMGSQAGFYQLQLHGFTSVPIALAIGGFFIAFNIPCFFYSLLATSLGIFLWFVIAPLLTPQGIPVLTMIFCIIVVLFIVPLRIPYIAVKIPWLFAVSLSHATRPEYTRRWYKVHKYAARYWKSIR